MQNQFMSLRLVVLIYDLDPACLMANYVKLSDFQFHYYSTITNIIRNAPKMALFTPILVMTFLIMYLIGKVIMFDAGSLKFYDKLTF